MKQRLSRHQWIGLAIIACMVSVVILEIHLFPSSPREYSFDVSQKADTSFVKRLSYPRYQRDTVVLCLRPFDPNTADSATLVGLGFRPWQASNMLKYRAHNGQYRRPEDLKKLYGMTDSLYQQILPYITIDTLRLRSEDASQYGSDTLRWRRDTLWHKRDTILDINVADTASLQLLWGVGSYTARRIVRYREELGGFVSLEQLREIDGLDSTRLDSLMSHLYVLPGAVQPIRVNYASVTRLKRHPYLTFEQAKAIYELRRMRTRLSSMEDLRALACLSEHDRIRLLPYLDFSD